MPKVNPVTIRDFSMGRYSKDVVSPALIPPNSVANSVNVNFDEIIGSGKVRNGVTYLGSGPTPTPVFGFAEFVSPTIGFSSELVTNGSFTGSAAGWTLGDGWTYGTNNAQWNSFSSELITNGSFTGSAAGWTLETGWTYGTNNVVTDGTVGSNLSQVISVSGNVFTFEYDVNGTTPGNLLVVFRGITTGSAVSFQNSWNAGPGHDGVTLSLNVASSASISFIPVTAGPFIGSIDNVSVKRVNDGTLSQDIGLVQNSRYKVMITVGGSSGSVIVQLGSTGEQFIIQNGTTATVSGFASGDSILRIRATNSIFNGTVDDVSVVQYIDRRLLLAANFNGTFAGIWWFDGSWNSSDLVTLTEYNKVRFATLGGYEFATNSSEGMYSSPNGINWLNGPANNCILAADVKPSLLYRYQQRMLASGDPDIPDRVFFSSVIDPTASPFITWDTNPVNGDWIDINPDDGGNITGFSEASTFLLVFKNTGMYRLDVINKTVNADNIFNVGAVNQESIVLCQGVVYFFSGLDVRRTNGGYPEQISRFGVQDIIDSMDPASWNVVASGTDGLNVWWSLGDITLNNKTITNCVIKFSTRDQTWSVHSYLDGYAPDFPQFSHTFQFFTQYTDQSGRLLRGATNVGVFTIDLGETDADVPISFSLETQEQEFGNRAYLKEISDEFAVFMRFGGVSSMQASVNGGDFVPLPVALSGSVNIGQNINLQGNYFTFRWIGSSLGTPPVFEGLYFEKVTSKGMIVL